VMSMRRRSLSTSHSILVSAEHSPYVGLMMARRASERARFDVAWCRCLPD